MEEDQEITELSRIQNKIYTIRGKQVMIDSDLAELYGVETKYLNRAVKRNIERFPSEFMFQLTHDEFARLRFQIGTSNEPILRSQNGTSSSGHGGRRYLPYAFNEQGVAMLSAVLKSPTAVKVSIRIMQAFVAMRKFILKNAEIFARLDKIEHKQFEHDKKFETIFKALENKQSLPQRGIFFEGQIFDAYTFVSDLIRSARSSIILIDNYVDDRVLTLLDKRGKDVKAIIYTKQISKSLQLDLQKHNAQYAPIEVRELKKAHDRFLIIDKNDVYHFGASLKDLGKKWFAFSKFDRSALKILDRL
jgi:hypothetical protein